MARRIYPITMKQYLQLSDFEYGGICLACGNIAHAGCEPDASHYECDECHELEVFGIEQALLIGGITIIEDSD